MWHVRPISLVHWWCAPSGPCTAPSNCARVGARHSAVGCRSWPVKVLGHHGGAGLLGSLEKYLGSGLIGA
eukprot:6611462-Karenia_brevis.AAC.1